MQAVALMLAPYVLVIISSGSVSAAGALPSWMRVSVRSSPLRQDV